MDYATLLYLAELLGVAVFAVTGAIAAQGKQLDIFGVVVLAIVTALGGGTIRDITMNSHPLIWISDVSLLWTAIISAVGAFILCRYLRYPRRLMLVLDAMGLALFAIGGAEKAMAAELPTLIVVMMAVITGCAGGMIRDLLTGEIPSILRSELYATCAVAGGCFYVMFYDFMDARVVALAAMLLIFMLRLATVFARLRLPQFVMAGHRLESAREARDKERD